MKNTLLDTGEKREVSGKGSAGAEAGGEKGKGGRGLGRARVRRGREGVGDTPKSDYTGAILFPFGVEEKSDAAKKQFPRVDFGALWGDV